MKKVISVILAVVLCLLCIPANIAFAQSTNVVETFDNSPSRVQVCENYSLLDSRCTQGTHSFCISTKKSAENYAVYGASAKVYYDYSSPLNLSGFSMFSIDVFLSQDMTGEHAVQVNFCTDKTKDDGFNANVHIDNLRAGWHTLRFRLTGGTYSGDSLNNINRLLVMYIDYSQNLNEVIMCFDNLRGIYQIPELSPQSNTVAPLNAMGDVDNNTLVNVIDALNVLKYSIDRYTLTDDGKKIADVNGDNSANSFDALMILQRSVNMDVNFYQYKNYGTARDEGTDGLTGSYSRVAGTTAKEGEICTLYQMWANSFKSQYTLDANCILSYVGLNSTVNYKEYSKSVSDAYGKEVKIGMMASANHAGSEYNSLFPERGEKDRQKRKDGTYVKYVGDAYYMVPTSTYVEFVWKIVEPQLKVGAAVVTLEEPEMAIDAGYSDGFKEEWKNFYGTDWVDPQSSYENMYKAQQLKVQLFVRELDTIGTRIKKDYPNVKFLIASHSTASYCNYNFTPGLGAYVSLDCVDGIIAQTWTDVANCAVHHDGNMSPNAFQTAMFEYSSFYDLAKGKDVYLLEDASSDGNMPESTVLDCYKSTLFAAMMQQDTSKFQNLIWPERAYTDTFSDAYKGYQLSVSKMLNEIGSSSSINFMGTTGVYIGQSDSAGLHVNLNPCNAQRRAMDTFYGLSSPLINDGVPVKCLDLDHITNVNDLKDVNLLILSYDNMKPLNERVNQIIAQWVKSGGHLLYIGGHDDYTDIKGTWWKNASTTPLQNLVSNLGLSISISRGVPENSVPTWESSDFTDLCKLSAVEASNTYTFSGSNFGELYKVGNKCVAALADAGNGRVILCGLPSAYFCQYLPTENVVCEMASVVLSNSSRPYYASEFYSSSRGRYYFYRGLKNKTGKTASNKTYIDLFSPELSIVKGGTEIPAEETKIFYDISSFFGGSTPKLAYTNGSLTSSIETTGNKTSFKFTAPDNSMVYSRFVCNGKKPLSVTATDSSGKNSWTSFYYDSASDTVLVKVLTGSITKNTTLTVNWGDKDAGNNKTFAKAEYQCTSGTVDPFFKGGNGYQYSDSYIFCDNFATAVWEFDLDKYPELCLIMTVGNNYQVNVSFDNKNWTKVSAYSDISKTKGEGFFYENTVTVNSFDYFINGSSKMYVQLTSCFAGGWGGFVKSYLMRYLNEEEYISKTFDFSTKKSTLTSDPLLCEYNCGTNDTCYFCDNRSFAIWRIDMEKYCCPIFTAKISQNYLLSMSLDDRNWIDVADYSKIGPKIEGGGNEISVDITASECYGFRGKRYMYIRLTSCYDGGFGGAITGYSLQYKERTPSDGKQTLEYYTNSESINNDPLRYVSNCFSSADSYYCDNNTNAVFAIDTKIYKDAVFKMSVDNNYVISVSNNLSDWNVIEDYSKIGQWCTDCTNKKDIAMVLKKYVTDTNKTVYVKLSSCYTDKSLGYGGRLTKYTLYYTGASTPIHTSLIKTDAQTVNSDPFLFSRTAGVDSFCYFCDNNTNVVWKIDTSKFPNPKMELWVHNSYKVMVSGDNENWITVADYSKIGPKVTDASNKTKVLISASEYGIFHQSRYMFVKLTSCYDGGHGGACENYRVNYSK